MLQKSIRAEYPCVRPEDQPELLLGCYLSGQISECQWQAHLEDEKLRAWLEARNRRVIGEGSPSP